MGLLKEVFTGIKNDWKYTQEIIDSTYISYYPSQSEHFEDILGYERDYFQDFLNLVTDKKEIKYPLMTIEKSGTSTISIFTEDDVKNNNVDELINEIFKEVI